MCIVNLLSDRRTWQLHIETEENQESLVRTVTSFKTTRSGYGPDDQGTEAQYPAEHGASRHQSVQTGSGHSASCSTGAGGKVANA